MEIIKKESYNYPAEKELEKVGLTSKLIKKLGSTPEEIEENIKNLHFDRPENELEVDRLLTDEEIELAKARVLEIQLDELPELQEKKAETDFEAKRMMKEAADLVNAKIAESRTHSQYLKGGIESEFLSPKNLIRVILNNHFVWFYVQDSEIKVVKIKEIQSEGLNALYDAEQDYKNKSFFGLNEVKKAE